MSKNAPEPKTDTLAETENYLVWSAEEPDGDRRRQRRQRHEEIELLHRHRAASASVSP